MLILLRERLENVRDAPDLPKVIRIAAIASLLVVEKYSKLSELSEVYRIAMGTRFHLLKSFSLLPMILTVMCPEKKLTWFDDEEAVLVEELVRKWWSEKYEKFSPPDSMLNFDGSPVKVCYLCLHYSYHSEAKGTQPQSKWLLNRRHQSRQSPGYTYDSIRTYLKEPVVSIHEVHAAGGVLQYWEKLMATRPQLARMALDFLSAPGEPSIWSLMMYF